MGVVAVGRAAAWVAVGGWDCWEVEVMEGGEDAALVRVGDI